MIQQRAVEKERSREANQFTKPGLIKRMQFTFSVDQPLMPATFTPCQKPDLKPSAEFKDNKRARPSTRASQPDAATNDKTHDDQPFTQRGCTHTHHGMETITITNDNETTSLRFPSLFSSDFGPRRQPAHDQHELGAGRRQGRVLELRCDAYAPVASRAQRRAQLQRLRPVLQAGE